ncbi:MAG TPA: hypothetical protein PKW95_20940 [bacterium]|nr:hypothetical protein [bacterium]
MNKRLLPIVSALLALALLAGSAFAETPAKTVDQLRADAEQLLLQQSEMYWRSYTEGEASDQASLYRQYAYLFTLPTIEQVKQSVAAAADPERKRYLGYFLHYLEVEYIGNEVAELWDIYFDLEGQLQVLIDGKMTPYRNLDGIMANEPDPAKRAEYAKEEYRVYQLLNSVVLRRIHDNSHRLAKDLGYKDYLELAVAYRMFDHADLVAKSKQFLEMSEALYLDTFDKVSSIPRDTFRRSDILNLLSNKSYDKYLTKENLLPSIQRVFADMGLNDEAGRKIFVDDKDTAKKVPRAACFPIRVPQDVRLTIKPIGGAQDYAALYHEFGHAQHFAHGATPVWEYQQLGSNAVTEAYAYTFESLPEREAWLKANTKMNAAEREDFRRRTYFHKLYMARRYMAKLIYETEFHQGVPDAQKRYQYWLSKAYGFQLNDDEATRYLSDLDPFLYAADYVQAFFLEAMMDAYLTKRFGKNWWTKAKAGAFFKELWQPANKMTGMEMVAKLGYAGYDNQMLLDYYRAGLQ